MNDPLLKSDAKELYEALSHLVRVYQFRDRDRICCYDVSVTQCYAIEVLVKQGPIRLQMLADQLFLDKSTTSRVVDTLERKGYALRVPSNMDKRSLCLQATEKGIDLFERIRLDLIDEQRALIKDLPRETRLAALNLLKQLTSAVEKRCVSSASNGYN